MTSVFNTPVKILIEKFKELSAEDKALFLLEVFTICNENNRIPIIRISKKISKTSKVVYTPFEADFQQNLDILAD